MKKLSQTIPRYNDGILEVYSIVSKKRKINWKQKSRLEDGFVTYVSVPKPLPDYTASHTRRWYFSGIFPN